MGQNLKLLLCTWEKKKFCEQLRETIEISLQKFKPHRIEVCRIIEKRFFGRDQNNTETNIF